MPAINIRNIPGGVYIPTTSFTYCKIVITADDGTDYTVMDTYSGSEDSNFVIQPPTVVRYVTEKIGRFTLSLINDEGRFLNVFNGGEIVKFYADSEDATTLIFYAKIDNVNYGLNDNYGFFVEIDGRAYPEIIDKFITGIEVAATADISLAGILHEFYNDVTLVFWDGNSWNEGIYNSSDDSVTFGGLCSYISHFKFDGDSSDERSTTTGTDANITYTSGKINSGASFNGTSSSINIGNRSFVGNYFSLCGWFKPTSLSSTRCLIDAQGTETDNNRIVVELSGGKLKVTLNDSNYDSNSNKKVYSGSTTLSTNIWYHYTITWDGTTLKLYINGNEETPTKTDDDSITLTNTNRLIFFGAYTSYINFYSGMIDDFRFYSDVLTSSEIGTLYLMQNIDFPTELINMTYQDAKGYNVVTEICKRVNLDCYLHHDGTKWYLRTFVQESIINSNASAAFGVNLIAVDNFGRETTQIFNRVKTYGKTESDNILLIRTKQDLSSQSNFWIKDRIVSAGELETMDEVSEKAEYELSNGINISPNGTITCLCNPYIYPGDIISVSVPYCNIDGNYKVYGFTHTFGFPFSTAIELVSKSDKLIDIFLPKVDAESFITPLTNPNNMQDSYTIYFDESPSLVNLSDTEIVDGKLRLESGKTTGTVITNILEMDYDITTVELRRYENYSTGQDTYVVTSDGGITWEPYEAANGETHTFGTPGRKIGVRMTLNRDSTSDPSPAYESICLLMK